jgi:hypothetical protein
LSAKKAGSSTSNPNPGATASAQATSTVAVNPTSASSVPPSAPADLLRGCIVAVDLKALDSAMQVVDENVTFNIGGTTTGVGKANLKSYLQTQLNAGADYSIDNVKATGDIVNFTVKVKNNPALTSGSIILSNGKMVIFRLQ